MKIEVGENREIRLKNVFNSVVFETNEGEELVVCMREGAFEIAILNRSAKSEEKYYQWYTASSLGIFPQSKGVGSGLCDMESAGSAPLITKLRSQ